MRNAHFRDPDRETDTNYASLLHTFLQRHYGPFRGGAGLWRKLVLEPRT